MQKINGINIAIASGSEKIQSCLEDGFSKRGGKVVLRDFLNLEFVSKLEQESSADVILIDMDDSYEENEDALDRLLESIDLPILFHDNDFDDVNDPGQGCGFSEQAIDKLALKLDDLVDSRISTSSSAANEIKEKNNDLLDQSLADTDCLQDKQKTESSEVQAQVAVEEDFGRYDTVLDEAQPDDTPDIGGATNVWVLGASIGGPEALKRFLAKIPGDLPVAFVLAQHLGDGFVSLLAEQLNRVSNFKVMEASAGDILKHGEVVIVPIENRMTLKSNGQIDFVEGDWKGHYKPSIDCVIQDVTDSYETRSGIIIFSGMGADGVLASQKFAEQYQGTIWAQTSETCVISSMPDSVRKANLVSYSGSPESLALKISMYYSGKNSN